MDYDSRHGFPQLMALSIASASGTLKTLVVYIFQLEQLELVVLFSENGRHKRLPVLYATRIL
jgi:hypothetical protein